MPASRRRRGAAAAVALLACLLVGSLFVTSGDASPPDAAEPSAPPPSPSPTEVSARTPSTKEVPRTRPTQAPAAGSPNVMFILMDDMRYDELQYMPNVQRYLLSRGLSFRNSFSPFPLCCPARASVVTGQYAHNHRVLYHDEPYGFGVLDDSRSLATAMQRAGYETGFTGKYLNLYGRQDSLVTGRPSIDYVPAGWSDWRAGLDTYWGPGSPFSGSTYHYFAFTQNVNGVTTSNRGQYSSTVIADDAIEMTKRFSREDRPWFLWVNPVAPHHGAPVEPDDPEEFTTSDGRRERFQTPARPDWVKGRLDDRIAQAPGLPQTSSPERDMSDKPRIMRGAREVTGEERLKLRDVARQRAESILAWDHEFGRIVKRLQALGEYDDTVFAFSSDNGYFLGEHRVRTGKIKPHEPSLRVPLVLAGPGIPEGIRYAPATTMDVTRTILDLAQAPTDGLPGQDGRSLLPVVQRDEPWDHPILTEAYMPGVKVDRPGYESGLTTIGVRTGRYKFVRYGNGDEELYDLVTDPLELDSRHDDPEYADVRDRMEALWSRYRNCERDACENPLPDDLVVDVDGLKEQWRDYARQNQAWYGVPLSPSDRF